MADYITTLLDDNEVDTLSPTTTFPALRDANGNYLDNTLAASDLNAAKNGKILDLVNNKVNKSDIADNLTTNDSTKVLSAKQGKILNDSINAINTNMNMEIKNLDVYQNGKMVTINIRDNISVDGSEKTLITGLPIPKNPYGAYNNVLCNSGLSAAWAFLAVDASGNLKVTVYNLNGSGAIQSGTYSIAVSLTYNCA